MTEKTARLRGNCNLRLFQHIANQRFDLLDLARIHLDGIIKTGWVRGD
ncbi:hypothetical protein D515_03242 [Grimontia indica]|uniref:Uncharacterized protein n=2 Tax=Grimontia TaxID=246861 RepID=R1GPA3_9GAMM|nr:MULTISPECIES: hypothetical protein [Grimontia]EOD78018.1 hypothetical protein D515_03242 [Grimontia indica]NGN98760.1 hypothetical protein [Grimontia sedimenti]